MKKIGFVLALLSSVSLTVLPVAPSYAATKSEQSTEQLLVRHAHNGNLAILSQAQMSQLAVSNPSLHAKLLKAYESRTVPHLTAAEKAQVRALTASNMDAFRAGDPATVWIIVAVSAVVLFILWQPVVCQIFPWAWGCAPVAVKARG